MSTNTLIMKGVDWGGDLMSLVYLSVQTNHNLATSVATCHSMWLLCDPVARMNMHCVCVCLPSHICTHLMKEADSIKMLALAGGPHTLVPPPIPGYLCPLLLSIKLQAVVAHACSCTQSTEPQNTLCSKGRHLMTKQAERLDHCLSEPSSCVSCVTAEGHEAHDMGNYFAFAAIFVV